MNVLGLKFFEITEKKRVENLTALRLGKLIYNKHSYFWWVYLESDWLFKNDTTIIPKTDVDGDEKKC